MKKVLFILILLCIAVWLAYFMWKELDGPINELPYDFKDAITVTEIK